MKQSMQEILKGQKAFTIIQNLRLLKHLQVKQLGLKV